MNLENIEKGEKISFKTNWKLKEPNLLGNAKDVFFYQPSYNWLPFIIILEKSF